MNLPSWLWPSRRPPLPPARACIFRWDLDKTYLKTEFDRVRDLVRIPFEKAADKVAAPGVTMLIRCLREHAQASGQEARVYFLTASPPQIGRAIKEKLQLDGVEYDGIAFKDQLQNLYRGKFRNLREQVGYKLGELMKSRSKGPRTVREFLFGDDWESDPLVYSLYADIVAGRLEVDDVRDLLGTIRVDPEYIEQIVALRDEIDLGDIVARIYINLERRTPPANFHWFGPRLVPTFNYFQTAACLYGDGALGEEHVGAVARSLVEASGYTPARLVNSLADVVRRGHLDAGGAAVLREHLHGAGLLPKARKDRRRRAIPLWQRLYEWVGGVAAEAASEPPHPIDYRALIASWRPTR